MPMGEGIYRYQSMPVPAQNTDTGLKYGLIV